MPKKRTKVIKKKQKNSLRKIPLFPIAIIASIMFALGLLVIQVVYNMATNPQCANSVSCIKNLSGEYEKDAKGEFMGRAVGTSESLAQILPPPQVLGENTGDKKIYIDLSTQKLFAKQGETTVYEFPVSTGKWWPTPTGTFNIWVKLRYTRMTGGNKAMGTYYNLPNVPYTMFFYNSEVPKGRGFGIHGAYWHNNFGHPMSHGCVNMKTEDVAQLFAWADPQTVGWTSQATAENPGTEIIIYGETPKE